MTVAALKQQVDDIAVDVRTFYPLVAGQEVMRSELARMRQDMEQQTAAVAQLGQALESDKRDRELVRRQREDIDAERARSDKRDRWVRIATVVTLTFTAISSTVAVIALVIQ
jgi:hypothetical protein